MVYALIDNLVPVGLDLGLWDILELFFAVRGRKSGSVSDKTFGDPNRGGGALTPT